MADFISDELLKLLEAAAYVAAILTVLGGALLFCVTKLAPWIRERKSKQALQSHSALEGYSDHQLERALRYYIPPNCQQIDPAGHEESRALALVQEPLFNALTRELNGPAQIRHIIILADAGMGKTSAVLNYCARHLRARKSSAFDVRVIHLGSPNADEMILETKAESKTVLFLDALDEDTKAIENHQRRIEELLELARPFRSIVITCRTQFFSREEEIPRETGIIKRGPRPAGEGAEYLFHKLYLSPFTDEQIDRYLRQRYPIWNRKKREKAQDIVGRMSQLSARPMLLAHVDDLLQHDRSYSYAFEIYDEMVNAWLMRESGFVKDSAALLNFSQQLAVDMYLNRSTRGAERIGIEEIEVLAEEWNIPLRRWQLTGRSLLNRDADGFFKFAHRSILEHLFVQRFWEGDPKCAGVHWTDQMMRFLFERLTSALNDRVSPQVIIPSRSPLHAALLREVCLLDDVERVGEWSSYAGKLLAQWLVDEGGFLGVLIIGNWVTEIPFVIGMPPSEVQRLTMNNGIGLGIDYTVIVAKNAWRTAFKRAWALCAMLGAERLETRSGITGMELVAVFPNEVSGGVPLS